MCETDIALANVKHTGYSTPQKETYKLLDDKIKNNKIFYPEKEVINKSQIFINLPSFLNKCMDSLWVEVKAGGTSDNPWTLPLILVCFILVYLIILLIKKTQKKKSIN